MGSTLIFCMGSPRQTRQTFQRTLELVKNLAPERITLLKYAHAPEVRKHMKLIDSNELPPATELPMFYDAVRTLTAAGYVRVGIDHCAKPSDDLAEGCQRKAGLEKLWRGLRQGKHTTCRDRAYRNVRGRQYLLSECL